MQLSRDLLIHGLNYYHVAQSGYYNKSYHVTARELTDGRTDTGGWGSETSVEAGAHIEAIFSVPVYVTSVTVGGGTIPAWGKTRVRNGSLKLEYTSSYNEKYLTVIIVMTYYFKFSKNIF